MRWPLVIIASLHCVVACAMDPQAAALLDVSLPPHGSIGEWRFLDGQQTFDEGSAGLHMSMSNGAFVANRYIKLDGTNDFAESKPYSLETSAFTFSAWARFNKLADGSAEYCISSQENSVSNRAWHILNTLTALNGTHTCLLLTGSPGGSSFFSYVSSSASVLTTTKVHHVVVGYDGATLSPIGALDGTKIVWVVGQPGATYSLNTNAMPVRIGARRSPQISFISGELGNAKYFNRALSEDEITRLYLEGPPQ